MTALPGTPTVTLDLPRLLPVALELEPGEPFLGQLAELQRRAAPLIS